MVLLHTSTIIDQQKTEEAVTTAFEEYNDHIESLGLSTDHLYLFIDDIINFAKSPIHCIMPGRLVGLDTSQPWFSFWNLQTLDILDEGDYIDQIANDVETYILRFLNMDGGFSGGCLQHVDIMDVVSECSSHISHLATTYAAVCTLVIIGKLDSVFTPERKNNLYRFISHLRDHTTGGWMMHEGGETDIRATYCAISVAKLVGILDEELVVGVPTYIANCQTYEGGICAGSSPVYINEEAHGGYNWCGLAALCILSDSGYAAPIEKVINIPGMLRWLVNNQKSFEGGFSGRTNKLVDACYSFWQGAALDIISSKVYNNTSHFDQENLATYIVGACQDLYQGKGGLQDKPFKRADFYHTAYALSGLSIAAKGGNFSLKFYSDESVKDAKFNEVDPLFNICGQNITSVDRNNPTIIQIRLLCGFIATIISIYLTYNIIGDSKVSNALEFFDRSFNFSLYSTVYGVLFAICLMAGPIYSLQNDLYLLFKYWLPNVTIPGSTTFWISIRNYLIAPVLEEICFRSCVVSIWLHFYIKNEWTPLKTIIFYIGTSACFGSAHLHHLLLKTHSLPIVLFQVIYTSVFGLFATHILIKTNHVSGAIFAHIICNLVGMPDLSELVKGDIYVTSFYAFGISTLIILILFL